MIGQINQLAENHIPFLLIVDFEMKRPLLYRLDELPDTIQFSTPSFSTLTANTNSNTNANAKRAGKINLEAKPFPYSSYRTAFNLVRENALAGNTYLCNLTFPSEITSDLKGFDDVVLVGNEIITISIIYPEVRE